MRTHLDMYLQLVKTYIMAYVKGDYDQFEVYREDVNHHWDQLTHVDRVIATNEVQKFYRELESEMDRLDKLHNHFED
jgi:hypothetical protein